MDTSLSPSGRVFLVGPWAVELGVDLFGDTQHPTSPSSLSRDDAPEAGILT
jgi:hypothetical protein